MYRFTFSLPNPNKMMLPHASELKKEFHILRTARNTSSPSFFNSAIVLSPRFVNFYFPPQIFSFLNSSFFFSQLCLVSGTTTSSSNTCRRSPAEGSAWPPGDNENYKNNDNVDHDIDKDDNDACRPGETVELPCDASDADKFVRVWMKVGTSSQ